MSNGSPLFSLKPFAGSKMFPRKKVMLKLQKGRCGFWQYLYPSQPVHRNIGFLNNSIKYNYQCTCCLHGGVRIVFDAGKYITGAIGREGIKYNYQCTCCLHGGVRIDFDAGKYILGPPQKKWRSLRSLPFQVPKKSRFLGPSLPMAPVMDFLASKSLSPSAI